MPAKATTRLQVIDSHTGGEPTRVVIAGWPDLADGPLTARRRRFDAEHAALRDAVVREPRGHDAMVGALLVPPDDPTACTGVVFFNNVGTLGMCGHGTMGLLSTLAYLGRIAPGRHRVDTPVGVVEAELLGDGRVTVRNVASYRYAAGVELDVPGLGRVVGDVAWGGNWFFLVHDHHRHDLTVANVARLTDEAGSIRGALASAGVTGADGAEIDHVELTGPSDHADARSFVLCPGGAYDRSPCGTGTSAALACHHAAGRLPVGRAWRQESVVGSVFEGVIERSESGQVWPAITGRAFVTGEATLVLDPDDPLCWGIAIGHGA